MSVASRGRYYKDLRRRVQKGVTPLLVFYAFSNIRRIVSTYRLNPYFRQ
jgi:hypothetical protein